MRRHSAASTSTASTTPRSPSSRRARASTREIVAQISAMKGEPEWMREFRLKALEIFRSQADADSWGGDLSDIDFENIYYYLKPAERPRRDLGRRARGHQEHVRRLASPRPSASSWPASAPVRARSRLPLRSRRTSQKKGVIFTDTDPALREHPDLVPRVLRHDHPADRQQVRRAQLGRLVGRLVHLRAQGRKVELPAAGLLPHQRREHGPVRADADHRRRRRRRALRRGLHRADVHQRNPALGGGRDHRQEGRPLPLHDDPELVEQHLQPRHQAGRWPTRTRRWSGSTATSAAG